MKIRPVLLTLGLLTALGAAPGQTFAKGGGGISSPTFYVRSALALPAGDPTSTMCSLADPCAYVNQALAVAYVTVGPTGAVINVGAGDFPGFTIAYQNFTVVGAGTGATFIDGNNYSDANFVPGTGAVVTIYDGTQQPLPTTLSQLTIENGIDDGACAPQFGTTINNGYSCGGGIANYFGVLTLNHVTVSNNEAYTGGGIYNAGFLSLNTSTVTGNFASAGGGIYNDNPAFGYIVNFGQVQLNSSQVTNNLAVSGGGIFNIPTAGLVALNTSTVSGNSAGFICNKCASLNQPDFEGVGGGVYNFGGSLSVTNSKVTSNAAAFQGGGVANGGFPDYFQSNALATVTGSSISNNQGGYEGGGGVANLFNANLTINNSPSNKSVVSSNQASIAGGVLNLFGGTVQVNGAQVVNNTAAEFGGGLINAVNGSMALTGALVKGNTASNGNGGGIVNECNGTLNLTNTMVQSNTAINGVGGGLYFNSTYPATLSGDTFTQNKPDAMNGGSTC